jgi:hypothetical protein
MPVVEDAGDKVVSVVLGPFVVVGQRVIVVVLGR